MPLLTANPTCPRRYKLLTQAPVDLTVTPPGTAPAGQVAAGELIFLTAANGVASLNTPGAANANAASCIGISNDTYPYVYGQGITATLPSSDPFGTVYVGVYEDGDHLMNTTVGDVYKPYQPLYVGADGRTIQATASGSSVGFVSPDQRASSTSSAPIVFGTAVTAGQQLYMSLKPALSK